MDLTEREKKLRTWEEAKGFEGIYLGSSIARKCNCGRATIRLEEAQCYGCGGKKRLVERLRCRIDGCTRVARKQEGLLCQPCWIAEDPERAARALKAWEEQKGFAGVFYGSIIARKCACGKPTRSLDLEKCQGCQTRAAKIAAGWKPKYRPPTGKRVPGSCTADGKRARKKCTTDGCERGAYHAKSTLCQVCWVKADPRAHGCPRCQKFKQTLSREDRLCWPCVQKAQGCAEGRLRRFRMPPEAKDALFDEVLDEEDADLDEELRTHLDSDSERTCVLVD